MRLVVKIAAAAMQEYRDGDQEEEERGAHIGKEMLEWFLAGIIRRWGLC